MGHTFSFTVPARIPFVLQNNTATQNIHFLGLLPAIHLLKSYTADLWPNDLNLFKAFFISLSCYTPQRLNWALSTEGQDVTHTSGLDQSSNLTGSLWLKLINWALPIISVKYLLTPIWKVLFKYNMYCIYKLTVSVIYFVRTNLLGF